MRHFAASVLVISASACTCLAQSDAAEARDGEIVSIARDTTLRVRVAAWFTNADGSLSVGEAFPGTISDIDLEEDLGLDTDNTVVMASIGLNLGSEKRWHIDVGYTGPFDYDGDSGPISISFNDRIFTGSVESQAEFDIYEFNVSYDLIRQGPLTFGLGGGTRVFDFDAEIRGTATDPATGVTEFSTESESAIVPLPGIGADLRLDLTENFFLRGTVRGIYAGGYGNFFDASGEVGFDLMANVGIFGGYRWLHAEADVDDLEFDVNVHGPYAGLAVRF